MKISALCTAAILLTALSAVAASPRTGQHPQGICTRDINSWGHAGSCACDAEHKYDPRSGLCLEDLPPEKLVIQGRVATDVMAIGGETTGFTIQNKEGVTYELILQTADQEKLRKLSGMWFEIEGEIILLPSIEVDNRTAIIAERIAVLE